MIEKTKSQDRLYWGAFSIVLGLVAVSLPPPDAPVLPPGLIPAVAIVYGVYACLTVLTPVPTLGEVIR